MCHRTAQGGHTNHLGSRTNKARENKTKQRNRSARPCGLQIKQEALNRAQVPPSKISAHPKWDINILFSFFYKMSTRIFTAEDRNTLHLLLRGLLKNMFTCN